MKRNILLLAVLVLVTLIPFRALAAQETDTVVLDSSYSGEDLAGKNLILPGTLAEEVAAKGGFTFFALPKPTVHDYSKDVFNVQIDFNFVSNFAGNKFEFEKVFGTEGAKVVIVNVWKKSNGEAVKDTEEIVLTAEEFEQGIVSKTSSKKFRMYSEHRPEQSPNLAPDLATINIDRAEGQRFVLRLEYHRDSGKYNDGNKTYLFNSYLTQLANAKIKVETKGLADGIKIDNQDVFATFKYADKQTMFNPIEKEEFILRADRGVGIAEADLAKNAQGSVTVQNTKDGFITLQTTDNQQIKFKVTTTYDVDNGGVITFAAVSKNEVIPYTPSNPEDPTNPEDGNVPTEDDKGNPVDKSEYDIVAFKVDPAKSGTLTLGTETGEVLSALVKKGTDWNDVTLPTTQAAQDYTFWYWDKKEGPVQQGDIRTAHFVKDGQKINPDDPELPDGFFKVDVIKGTGIADDELFGKTYAVKENSTLSQDKFPILKTLPNFKNPTWDLAEPWNQAIVKDTKFTASAVSSIFDEGSVVAMEVTEQPRTEYKERETLDLSEMVITLTDKNDNKKTVAFSELAENGITANPAHGTKLTVVEHNGIEVLLEKGELTAQTNKLTVTKNNSTTPVVPFKPSNPDDPTNPEDPNIPGEDDKGDTIIKDEYEVVAFKVDPDKSGTLTLEKVTGEVISALVKKGTDWNDVTLPTTQAAQDYTFWYWDKKEGPVQQGDIRTAHFVKDGQKINPDDPELPDGFFRVEVLKGDGVREDDLFGKYYAVKENSTLSQDKFPTLVIEGNYKDAKWFSKDQIVEEPWNQSIVENTMFTEKATALLEDLAEVSKIEQKYDEGQNRKYIEAEVPGAPEGTMVQFVKDGNPVGNPVPVIDGKATLDLEDSGLAHGAVVKAITKNPAYLDKPSNASVQLDLQGPTIFDDQVEDIGMPSVNITAQVVDSLANGTQSTEGITAVISNGRDINVAEVQGGNLKGIIARGNSYTIYAMDKFGNTSEKNITEINTNTMEVFNVGQVYAGQTSITIISAPENTKITLYKETETGEMTEISSANYFRSIINLSSSEPFTVDQKLVIRAEKDGVTFNDYTIVVTDF